MHSLDRGAIAALFGGFDRLLAGADAIAFGNEGGER
jgi:hypothetical protein